MITQSDMPKLLGRPLTSLEVSNYNLYLDSARQKLDTLLCINTDNESETRTYKSRVGYSEIRIEPFTAITSVLVDGDAVTDYRIKQGDNYTANWYNTIEFAGRFDSEQFVVVTADWGYGTCPTDLCFLVAKLFNLASTEHGTSGQIKSKSIEDVSITFDNSVSPMDSLRSEFKEVIAKYSSCSGYIRSGDDGLTSGGF